MLLEVEHVKARRTKEEWQQMTLFEQKATGGNERVDELAKDGAMLDGGGPALFSTKREVYEEKWISVEKNGSQEASHVRTDQQEGENAWEMLFPKAAGQGFQSQAEQVEKSASGRTRHGEESEHEIGSLGVVQKVFRLSTMLSGTEPDEPLQDRKERHELTLETFENISRSRRRIGARGHRSVRGYERSSKLEVFIARRFVEHRQTRMQEDRGSVTQRGGTRKMFSVVG